MTEHITLRPGDRVQFGSPRSERRRWWTVRATSENGRWAVLTRQAAFMPKGTNAYTIIDWQRGVRGPCNLIGQGWGDGSYSTEECQEIIRALETRLEAEEWFKGKPRGTSRPITEPEIEVSYRNNVEIDIAATLGVSA